MRSFFDALRRIGDDVILCPTDGKLPKDFRPVPVEPWQPEPRRPRSARRRRDITVERVEEINSSLNWSIPLLPGTSASMVRLGEAGTDEPLEPEHSVGHVADTYFDPYEFDDWRYGNLKAAETYGVRSLMEPQMAAADYSWRAPAARCRSCGAVTWIASIADGVRMLVNPRHRKTCTAPPSRLEVELSCHGT